MENVKRVPKLRFAEFSGDWKVNPFKDLVKISQGLQISISERLTEQEEGSLFYITNEFLREKSETKYFIKNAPSSVICNKKDVLMTRTGNTGKVVTDVEGAFHNNFFKIAYPKEIDKGFLVNFLNLNQTQNIILRLAGTSTIPDLNHSDFYKIIFNYPGLLEQQKIASFLSSVDKKIELLTKKKTLLEDYKKGVMQQLFSPFGGDANGRGGLRFKDDDGSEYPDWEEKRLKELVEKIASGKIKPKLEGNYNVYGSTGIIGKCNNYSHSGKFLLIARVGANAGKINHIDGNFGVTDNTLVIQVKEDLNLLFLKASLVKYNLNRLVFGSGQPLITGGQLRSLKLGFPCIEEQTKIANFLSALDKKIELVNSQLENTQQFKKGLLQQMFV